jgi:hypothetical protein
VPAAIRGRTILYSATVNVNLSGALLKFSTRQTNTSCWFNPARRGQFKRAFCTVIKPQTNAQKPKF